MTGVTEILEALKAGQADAAEALLAVVYDELRLVAAAKLAREPRGQTLDATGLVHEAWLRLSGPGGGQDWENRRHFFAAAAEAMRRILVENARRKKRIRHGGGFQRIELRDEQSQVRVDAEEVLAIDDVLSKLAQEDSTAAEIVKLRYFIGLSVEEAAESIGLSRATAYRHWTYARAWLQCELDQPH